MRVDRHPDDLRVEILELLDTVRERDYLRGTHERAVSERLIKPNQLQKFSNSQIQRVEEKNQILAFVVSQLDLLEVIVDDGSARKVRCWLLNMSGQQT